MTGGMVLWCFVSARQEAGPELAKRSSGGMDVMVSGGTEWHRRWALGRP